MQEQYETHSILRRKSSATFTAELENTSKLNYLDELHSLLIDFGIYKSALVYWWFSHGYPASRGPSIFLDKSGRGRDLCQPPRKHSIDELKNLAFHRFLTCKKPCKDLTLCNFSHMKYSEKCFNQIYRALYGDTMAAVKVLKTAVDEFCHKIDNLTLE